MTEVGTPGPVLVIVPTYNEAVSLPAAVKGIRTANPDIDILVVDDNSPDGTGDLAAELALSDVHVHVLHRARKAGLGAAYIAGFRWGLGRDYQVFVEMDADGSHRVEHLGQIVDSLEANDVVIGSRWAEGGEVLNWPKSRELLSRGGNAYARVVLGLGVRDVTAGYRAYRRQALEQIDLGSVRSQGYCFQVDLTRRCARAGLRIAEVPITFVERTEGESKMSMGIVAEALLRVAQWGAQDRFRQLTGRRTR